MVVGHDGHHRRPYDIEDGQVMGLIGFWRPAHFGSPKALSMEAGSATARATTSQRCLACQSAGKTQKFVPVRSSFGESRLCLFSLLELFSSPSQCLLRLFLVQLLYPCSHNCCVAQKA